MTALCFSVNAEAALVAINPVDSNYSSNPFFYIYDTESGIYTRYNTPDGRPVNDLEYDSGGTLFIGTESGIYSFYENAFSQVPNAPVVRYSGDIAISSDGMVVANVWDSNNVFYVTDPDTGTVRPYTVGPRIIDLEYAPDGRLLFGADRRYYTFSGGILTPWTNFAVLTSSGGDLAISSSGLVASNPNPDNIIYLFDIDDPNTVAGVIQAGFSVFDIEYGIDDLLYVMGPNGIYTYDGNVLTGAYAYGSNIRQYGPHYFGDIAVYIPEDIPEPATTLLFGIGLAGIGLTARRRRKAA